MRLNQIEKIELVNRHDVLAAVARCARGGVYESEYCSMDAIEDAIASVPKYHRPQNYWMKEIYVDKYGRPDPHIRCGGCGFSLHKRPTSRFCPNCGTFMIGTQEG